MESTKIEIDKLIEKWELENDKLVDEKNSILNKWKNDLDSDTFDLLIRICEEIIYYSPNLVSEKFTGSYQNFLDENESSEYYIYFLGNKERISNIKKFKQVETKYLPLRTEDRVESSNTIFLNFIKTVGIPVALTSMDKPEFLLEKKLKFENEILTYQSIIKEYGGEGTKEFEEEMYTYAHENQEMLDLENIVLVDDFIGSGKSVKNFLESIRKYHSLFERVNLYIIVLEASTTSLELLNEYAMKNNLNFAIIITRLSDNILDSILRDDERSEAEKLLLNLNNQHSIRESEYCINNISISYVSSPNNNIPFIYFKSDLWTPIFIREDKRPIKKVKKTKVIEKLKSR